MPLSSGILGSNGGTPLHTACSVRLNAFHIRQHRGHTRGHRPRRPRPRVASHGSDSLSRPSRVPSSRGTSERNLPSRSCRYRRPRSARIPAHRRNRLQCNLDRSRVPFRPLKEKRRLPVHVWSRIHPGSQADGSGHRIEGVPAGQLAHSHRRMRVFVARATVSDGVEVRVLNQQMLFHFHAVGSRPNHPSRTG